MITLEAGGVTVLKWTRSPIWGTFRLWTTVKALAQALQKTEELVEVLTTRELMFDPVTPVTGTVMA